MYCYDKSSVVFGDYQALCFGLTNGDCLSSVVAAGVQRTSKLWFSTDTAENDGKESGVFDELLGDKDKELKPQGVDPTKGWLFRGVHKVYL